MALHAPAALSGRGACDGGQRDVALRPSRLSLLGSMLWLCVCALPFVFSRCWRDMQALLTS